VGLLGF